MDKIQLGEHLLRKSLDIPANKGVVKKKLRSETDPQQDIREVNKLMKGILKEFERVFPTYIETGFQIRDALPDSLDQDVFFICGTETVVKFYQETQTFKTLNIVDRVLNSLTLNKNASLMYISTNNKEIIEVDALAMKILREIKIEYVNSEFIFYSEVENTLYSISKKCIFSLDLKEEQLVCKEKFSGEFSYFTYNYGQWLLGDKNGQIMRINSEGKEFTFQLEEDIRKVKWSRSKELVIVLSANLIVLLTTDLQVKSRFELDLQPLQATMTENERYIFVSTIEGFIVVVNCLSGQVVTIPVHRGRILNFLVNKSYTKIITFGHDSKIGYLNIPINKKFKSLNCNSLKFAFCGVTSEIIYIENSKSLKIWNFLTDTQDTLYDDSPQLAAGLRYLVTTKKVVFSDTNAIIFYDVQNRKVSFKIPLAGVVYLTNICTDTENNFIFTLANKNAFIYVYDLDKRDIYGIMKGHSARITCLEYISKLKCLATGGNDNMVILWDYLNKKKKRILKGHTTSITCLAVTREENKIISGSKDMTIKVWYCSTGQLLITLQAHESALVKVKVDKNNSLISASIDGTIVSWNLRTYSKIFVTKIGNNIGRLSLNRNNRFVAYSTIDQIAVTEYHAFSESLDVIGPNMNKKYEYMSYLLKILKGDKVEYDQEWDSWAVLPYQFNTMYFYTYANIYKHIRKCILNKTSLIPSIYADPFTMVIHKNYQRCLRVFFASAEDLLINNIYSLCFLSGDILVKLNLQGHNHLHLFYQSVFRKFISEDFPKFADSHYLPNYVLSDTLIPISESFIVAEKTKETSIINPQSTFVFNAELQYSRNRQNTLDFSKINEEDDNSEDVIDEIQANKNLVPTVLYISTVRMNYLFGSQESLNFIVSLIRCSNKEVFRTKFIQSLLNMKWAFAKKYQIIQALFYTVFLLVLLFYVVIFYETEIGVWTLLGVGSLLFLYDAYQLYISLELFFRDVWNYFDILRLIFLVIYSFMFVYDSEFKSIVMTLITMSSFLRGISFFRLFNKTRYMIQLLLSIINDIWSFAILLTYSTVSFCIIFMVQGYEKGDTDFFEFMKHSVLINLGEFDFHQYHAMDWITFFLAASMNLILMLNMLIAIMGETFTKVRENSEIADYIEIAGMILEVETTFFAYRRMEQKSYFQMCEAESILSKKEDILAQDIKEIKKAIVGLRENFKAFTSNLN